MLLKCRSFPLHRCPACVRHFTIDPFFRQGQLTFSHPQMLDNFSSDNHHRILHFFVRLNPKLSLLRTKSRDFPNGSIALNLGNMSAQFHALLSCPFRNRLRLFGGFCRLQQSKTEL